MKTEIEELLKEYRFIVKGLHIIEELAASHENPDDKSQNQKDWNRVYQIAHTLSSPDCRKNHSDWIKEIGE